MAGAFDWSIVIFGMNEEGTIAECLTAVDRNAVGRRVQVSVVLNGSTDGSAAVLRAHRPGSVGLTVYAIPTADKANAINQYIYTIRPRAAKHFFMDAYVMLGPGALAALSDALDARPDVTVVSGLPLNGRSAPWHRRHLLEGGAINGNIYGVREAFLDRLAAERLRLPLRIYRTDPLLGSVAAHDFDAITNPWNARRLIGVEDAGYTIRPLSPFRPGDIRRQWRREINQARGLLESAAIKSIIYRDNYAALPEDADEMLRSWLRGNDLPPTQAKHHLFLPLAKQQLRAGRAALTLEGLRPAVLHRTS